MSLLQKVLDKYPFLLCLTTSLTPTVFQPIIGVETLIDSRHTSGKASLLERNKNKFEFTKIVLIFFYNQ